MHLEQMAAESDWELVLRLVEEPSLLKITVTYHTLILFGNLTAPLGFAACHQRDARKVLSISQISMSHFWTLTNW